jgi:hypothetical protein
MSPSSESPGEQSPAALPNRAGKPRMKQRWLLIILALTFLFVLMPFLFWQGTWFGRPLNDAQLEKALGDREHPREIQHALSQIADRILGADPNARNSVRRFYPDIIRVSQSGGDELRLTAAWVMGQDNTVPEFHEALLRLLHDANPMVRRNAALALVRFGDTAGRDEIRNILQPYTMAADRNGKLLERLKPQDAINPGTMVGRIDTGERKVDLRSQVPGTIDAWIVPDGSPVTAGQPVLRVLPSVSEVWEALRALYLTGEKQDASLVEPFSRPGNGMPPNVRQQAELTMHVLTSR